MIDSENNSTLQRTLSRPVSFQGKGLHTGQKAHITLRPAQPDTGIIFRHITANGQPTDIPAHWKKIKTLPLCTCIAAGDVQIRTIEHLMAALYACQITNLLIEVSGNEIPILDGSAYPFIKDIETAGTEIQNEPVRYIKILKPVEFTEEERFIRIEPSDDFAINLSISLAKIGKLNWQGKVTPDLFKEQISPARTFGRLRNGLLAKLFTRFKKDPTCLGANTSSALVIVGDKVINKGGLRMPDEIISHRVLDTVGDMMLIGAPIKGSLIGNSTAHRLNHGLMKKLFSDDDAWRWEES